MKNTKIITLLVISLVFGCACTTQKLTDETLTQPLETENTSEEVFSTENTVLSSEDLEKESIVETTVFESGTKEEILEETIEQLETNEGFDEEHEKELEQVETSQTIEETPFATESNNNEKETKPYVEQTTATEIEETIQESTPENETEETQPVETEKQEAESEEFETEETEPEIHFTEVNETVYVISSVNVRTGPSVDYEKIGSLNFEETVTRIGIGDNGWSKILFNGQEAYASSNYLSTEKPVPEYPIHYSDATSTITIYKEWYGNAYVYAAHLQFSDYSRFGTECANGIYTDGNFERTSHAARRIGAIFMVNGCYSAPYLNYTVVRGGQLFHDGLSNSPGVYSKYTGVFCAPYTIGVSRNKASEVLDKFTDTFCFGPEMLKDGNIVNCNDGSRAQRTFIGTNGAPGDIWVCVSDGRKNDGRSPGLTYRECAEFLISKGCSFGIPLDGGGSSTMYFDGKVLNAARGNERAVVDFVYFR